MRKFLLVIAALLIAIPAHAGMTIGPLTSGSPQSPPIPTTLQEATNVLMPAQQLGANTAIMCRVGHFTRGAVTSVQFVWPGWFVKAITSGAGIGNENSSGTYPITSWVEYPVGTYTQVDNALTVAAGTNTLGTKKSINIPTNTKFYTWHYSSGASSNVPVFGTTGTVLYTDEACQSGAGTPTTPSSTLPTDNHSRSISFGPIAIIGPSLGPAVYILGDSRTQGTNDTANGTYDRGDLARSVGSTFNYINAGVAGDDPSMWIGGAVNRRALIQYTTNAVSELGFNLFFNKQLASATALNYAPWLQGFFAGMPYVRTTLEPYTGSTDGWTTSINQTIPANGVNAEGWTTAVKTDANFIDLLGPVQDLTNANKWLSSAGAITADGVHPNAAGYQDIFATASAIVGAINAATPAAVLPTTNFNTTAGSATYDTATQKIGTGALKISSTFAASVTGLGGSSFPMTMECYFKGSTPSNFATFWGVGQGFFNLGSGTTGHATVRQATGVTLASTTVITDGNWHHLAYTDTGAAQVLYVDGTSVATATVNAADASLQSTSVFIGGGVASELDECAYWNTLHYTGNFTPPTSAYVGNETGLIAVWHFDQSLAGHSGPVLVPNQTPAPPTPVISSLTCSATLPVTSSTNLSPTCQAVALCNSAPCTGSNAITTWTLNTQSNANFFSFTNAGVFQGGSASPFVIAGNYTATVTATTAASQTSAPTVQAINVAPASCGSPNTTLSESNIEAGSPPSANNFGLSAGPYWAWNSTWNQFGATYQNLTVTFTNGSAVIGATGNKALAGQLIEFQTTGGLPTNFSPGPTNYFISATGLTGSHFEVAATAGGTPIVAGSAGSGTQTASIYYTNNVNFTQSIALLSTSLPNCTTISNEWPSVAVPGVWGYPAVFWGNYANNVPTTTITPNLFANINNLIVNWNITLGGVPNMYDGMMDAFTTRVNTPGSTNYAHEIETFFHTNASNWEVISSTGECSSGCSVFYQTTYTDANGQNWMVASGSAQTPPQVFFAACDNTCSNPVDLTNYALDLKAMYNWGASHFATVATTFTNSSAVISATNHFHSGDRVQFATTGALPTNFSVATDYWVSATGLSGTQFEVSATQGGSVITAGSAGSGTQTTNHFYLWDANEWFVGVPFGNEPAMNGLATPVTFTNGSAVIGGTNVYQAGDQLQLTTTGTLPTNFALNTTYFVLSTGLSSSQFELSATSGGTAIVAGSAGSGTNTANWILVPNSMTINSLSIIYN